jgi:hypothetical protein
MYSKKSPEDCFSKEPSGKVHFISLPFPVIKLSLGILFLDFGYQFLGINIALAKIQSVTTTTSRYIDFALAVHKSSVS